VILGLILGAMTIIAAIMFWSRMAPGRTRNIGVVADPRRGFFLFRYVFDGGVAAVEASTRPARATSAGSACR
jgi:branched-chain amino acid transport system permease protein